MPTCAKFLENPKHKAAFYGSYLNKEDEQILLVEVLQVASISVQLCSPWPPFQPTMSALPSFSHSFLRKGVSALFHKI